MLKVKADILPFLILSAYLIFSEKIVIARMCLIGAVLFLWLHKFHLILILCHEICRSISNKDVWRSIILVIKKSKHLYYNTSSNKFLKYETEGNAVKMNRSGKCESEIL